MAEPGAGSGPVPPRGLAQAIALLAAATLIRLAIAASLPLVDDEAYYWTWSTRLAAGYYDHPPAIAWIIAAGTAMFGKTALGVRAGGIVLTFVATLPLLTLVESPVLLAMVLSSLPLFALGGILATPDIPLIAGWMLALAGVSRMGDARHPWRWALLAGLGGGLAALGKYTAWGFWPLVGIAALTLPKLQRVSRTLTVLLGALFALATSAPNLLWNADHDFVSVAFQLHHGLGATAAPGIAGALEFAAAQLGLGGGVLFGAGLAAAWAHRHTVKIARFALCTSVPVLAFFTLAATRSHPEANWAAPAFVGLAVLIAGPKGAIPTPRITRTAWIGSGFALALCTGIVVHAFHPFLRIPNDPVARLGMGAQLASPVEAWGIPNVWTTRYQEAALLRWYGGAGLADATTVPGLDRADQFDIWRAEDGPSPRDGLFVRGWRAGEPVIDTLCERGGPNLVEAHDDAGAVTSRWQVYEVHDCRF